MADFFPAAADPPANHSSGGQLPTVVAVHPRPGRTAQKLNGVLVLTVPWMGLWVTALHQHNVIPVSKQREEGTVTCNLTYFYCKKSLNYPTKPLELST
jgi:hypothetical protein